MYRSTIIFVNMGRWYLYHKVAENLNQRGWNVEAITYGYQLKKHCEALNLYTKVYDLSLEIHNKEKSITEVKHLFKDISINEIVKSDRFFNTKRKIGGISTDSFYTQIIEAIDDKISRKDVMGIFYEPSSAISLFCGEISKYYNKIAVYPQWGRTNLGMSISNGYNGAFKDITNNFNQIELNGLSSKELEKIDTFKEGVLSETLRLKLESNVVKRPLVKRIALKLKNSLIAYTEQFKTKYPIKGKKNKILGFYDGIVRSYRKRTNKKYFRLTIPNKNIIFFPLHYDPDLSSLLYSRNNSNQIEVIRKLSLNIPDGYTLVVKEHPGMRLNRSKNFYKAIINNYNVLLVDNLVTSRQLIESCDAVITLSGTVGFESVFYGKKAIVLADDYYDIPELFDRVTDYRKIKEIIEKNVLDNNIENTNIDKFALAYLRSVTYVKQYRGTISYENVTLSVVDPIADYVEGQLKEDKT